jgi:hypothetical protein
MERDFDQAIQCLEAIREQHESTGMALYKACGGKFFPCDALYLSVLNRSLELFDGFALLMKNNKYGCSMVLLRMQLDNVLRFFGVLHTEDAHATANAIFNGAKLSSLKDKRGEKLQDFYLVKIISKNNSWVKHVYRLSSGYVHLSDQHIHHMIGRSIPTDNGERKLYIGSDDEHIEPQHKVELINAFIQITKGVFLLQAEWEELSKMYNASELELQYSIHT